MQKKFPLPQKNQSAQPWQQQNVMKNQPQPQKMMMGGNNNNKFQQMMMMGMDPYMDEEEEEEEGSIVLEEEIDENYQPTQKEVIEYATFLGMDLNEDRDLFYIAKEGLKAPLPDPWKPCQSRTGEIYYMNFENGQKTFDHPCDEYYKSLYQREKQKKLEKMAMAQAQLVKQSILGPEKVQEPMLSICLAFISLFSKIVLSQPIDLYNKQNDPIIKQQQEKQLKQFREQKEKELEQKKKQIDQKYEGLKKSADQEYEEKLALLKKNIKNKAQEEKESYQKKIKELEESSDFHQMELELYEKQLRAELERTHQTRMDAEKKSMSQREDRLKEQIKDKYDTLMRQQKKDLEKKADQEYQQLLEQERQLRLQMPGTVFDEEKELEDMQRKFREELESQHQSYVQSKQLEYEEQLETFKQMEQEKLERDLQMLVDQLQKEKRKKTQFNEEQFRQDLEQEYQDDIKRITEELKTKSEVERMKLKQKMKEEEIKAKNEIQDKLKKELRIMEEQFEQEKNRQESCNSMLTKIFKEFNLEKQRIDQRAQEDFLRFKQNFDSSAQQEEIVIINFKPQIYHQKLKQYLEQDQFNRLQKEQNLQENIDRLKHELKLTLSEQNKFQKEVQDLQDNIEYLEKQIEKGKQLQKDKYQLKELNEQEKVLLDEIQQKNAKIVELKKQIDQFNMQRKIQSLKQADFEPSQSTFFNNITKQINELQKNLEKNRLNPGTRIEKSLNDVKEQIRQERDILKADIKLAQKDIDRLEQQDRLGRNVEKEQFNENMKLMVKDNLEKLNQKLAYLNKTEQWIKSNQ